MKPGLDDLRPIVAIMASMGVAGLLAIAGGLAEFVHFEPPGHHSGLRARITGVYRYDPASNRTDTRASDRFAADEPFAAVVDWQALPGDLVVAGRWFVGDFGYAAGGAGPLAAADMARAHTAITTDRNPDGTVPADTYEFVVERFEWGRPVEVIARTSVAVTQDRRPR